MKDNPVGECCCVEPLIERNGVVLYPKDFGPIYRCNTPMCKLWKSKIPEERLQIRLEPICGNCKWWEITEDEDE